MKLALQNCARMVLSQVTGHESRDTPCASSRYNRLVRERLEYAAVWLLFKTIGAMPRPLARFAGASIASVLFWLRPVLRATAAENLKLAFPDWTAKQHE